MPHDDRAAVAASPSPSAAPQAPSQTAARLRVAHVISTPSGLGGAERFLVDLVSGAAGHGVTSTVLNPFAAADGEAALADLLPAGTYRCTVTGGLRGLPHARRWLAQSIETVQPDLVHVHLFHAAVLAATVPLDVPLLLTHHHGDVLVANRRRLAEQVDRLAERRYDHIVAVSDRVRDFLVTGRHVPEGRVSVIPNGWAGRPLPRHPGRQPTVVCVANFRPEKEHELLLAAFRRVLSQVPDARLRLVGAGPGRARIEAAVQADPGLAASVAFAGAIDDVWPELAAADVFVLASRYEGMSVALLEAMAAGLPAVVTDVGANRQLVDYAPSGTVVPVGDAEALADALTGVLRDPVGAAALGRAAAATAANFTFARTVDAYVARYRQLAPAGRAS